MQIHIAFRKGLSLGVLLTVLFILSYMMWLNLESILRLMAGNEIFYICKHMNTNISEYKHHVGAKETH